MLPSVNCSSNGESAGARIAGVEPREWLVEVLSSYPAWGPSSAARRGSERARRACVHALGPMKRAPSFCPRYICPMDLFSGEPKNNAVRLTSADDGNGID